MALTIGDLDILQEYICGVMRRSGHHAGGVDSVVLAVIGGIMWKAQPGSIVVRAQNGRTTNVLWVEIGGQRLAFCYSHDTDQIEVRQGSIRGPTICTFDNSTPHVEVRRAFEMLAATPAAAIAAGAAHVAAIAAASGLTP